jgi:hypothetical protein
MVVLFAVARTCEVFTVGPFDFDVERARGLVKPSSVGLAERIIRRLGPVRSPVKADSRT